MALVLTVLLLTIAATIVLALASQSLMQTRTSSAQANSDQASVLAANAQAALTSALQADPYFFLSNVFTTTINGVVYSEQARVCAPTGAIVQPGSTWSSSLCGTSWNYTPATIVPAGSIELVPPSLSNPLLGVYIEGNSGDQSSALYITYRLDSPSRFSLWSSSPLDLSKLPTGSTLTGSIYTSSTIGLPGANQTVSAAQLEAEQGFTTTPTDTSLRYYAQATTTNSPPIQDIRSVAPAILTTQSLRASMSELTQVACPSSAPFWNQYNQTASSLCLTAGATVLTGPNSSVKIPANVTGYLLIFNGSANTVTVYYSTRPINPDPNCNTSACDFITQANADSTANPPTNPGQLSYWTSGQNAELGVLPLPNSGVIFADHDTFLGACSTGANIPFATLNGTCPVLSGTQPGMLVGSNVTVLAGSATSPANVWLDSSINTSPGVSFGALATGSLLLPYWARPPGTGTSQVLDGSYVALGYSSANQSSAISPFPIGPSNSNPDNVAGSLVVSGSLAAPSLDTSTPYTYFTTAQIGPSEALTTSPPPYFVDFDGLWSVVSSQIIEPSTMVFPSYPTALSATSATKSANLTWTAPGMVSSSTYYIATSSPGGLTCTTQTTSCTVTGLTSGTSYTFTVQTVTSPQISPSSLPSNSITAG